MQKHLSSALFSTLVLVLTAWSLYRFSTASSIPHHTHPVDSVLPSLQESPWPVRIQLDYDALPWILDPHSAWPSPPPNNATPCDTIALLQTRYPLWYTSLSPKSFPSQCPKPPAALTTQPTFEAVFEGSSLILERQIETSTRLVLDPQRGLLLGAELR